MGVCSVDIGSSRVSVGFWFEGKLVRRCDLRYVEVGVGGLGGWLGGLLGEGLEAGFWSGEGMVGVSCVKGSVLEEIKGVFDGLRVSMVCAEDCGMEIAYRDVRQLGSDRIANGLAARRYYPEGCVVVDVGSATNFDVIGRGGVFLGGVIIAGMELGLEGLLRRAERLKYDAGEILSVGVGREVICRDTESALRIGSVLGHCGSISYLLERIEGELGYSVGRIFTGGGGFILRDYFKEARFIEDLTHEGIYAYLCERFSWP